jgi:hypothetical protein
MKRILGIAIGGMFLMVAAGAHAAAPPPTAPGAGGTFDCTKGICSSNPAQQCATASDCGGTDTCDNRGTTSCATDDSGCVSHTKNQLKCSQGLGTAFCKLVTCVIGCHKKQADSRFKGATASAADTAEDTCEGTNNSPATEKSCGGKFNAAVAKLGPTGKNLCEPIQISNANGEAAVLIGHPSPLPALSLDGQNDNVYCDSTQPALIGGDDEGWVPGSKGDLACQDAEGKAIAQAVCCSIKCHSSMASKFFAGKDFDEEACEETNAKGNGCQNKFNKSRDKAIAKGCNACNQAAGWDAQFANGVGTVDGANNVVYPCGLP